MKYIIIFLLSLNIVATEINKEKIDTQIENNSIIKKDNIKRKEKKTNNSKRKGVKISLLGNSIMVGVSFDYFITSYLDIEATISGFPSIGAKLYPFGGLDSKIGFYLGGYILFPLAKVNGGRDPIIYTPLGLEYITSDGATITGEFGPIGIVGGCCIDCTTNEMIFLPWIGFKFGKRF